MTLGEEKKMGIRLVISEPKSGKTLQKEIADDMCEVLYGKKIGEKIDGDMIGLSGYEFEIRGGSDFCGFPMRKDVDGTLRKKILAVSGVGIKKKDPGIRTRKTVAGNTVYDKTAQINVKVLKIGSDDFFAEKAEEKSE
jgi:small subunit ribosomal protein S6e